MLEHISHIGIVVDDLESAVSLWTDQFGYREVERMSVEVEGVRSVFVSPGHLRGEGMVVELIEPVDKADMTNAIARRLSEVGPGFFHIGIFANDPAAESARLRGAGLTVLDLPPASESEPPRGVIHPKSALGVLMEILPRP
jgi:methylmalonyl-CoA/ethylmalonyl-CoA epimerase